MNPWIRWRDDAAGTEPAWRWLAGEVAMPALLATPARPLAEMAEPAPHLDARSGEKLVALLGAERVKLDLTARVSHGAASTADRLRLRTGDLSRLPDAVLYPRSAEDVLTLLRFCAEADIAITPFGSGSGFEPMPQRGPHCALVSVNLSALSHLLSIDAMSGLAEVEAGITAHELARQLAAQGLMLKGTMEGSLGGFIARNRQVSWLQAVKLATPQGLLRSGHVHAPGSRGTLGIITGASIRIRALPAKCEYRRYLFADFAAGLAALREAERQGLSGSGASLSDAAETRFHHQMEQIGRRRSLSQWLADLYRQMRQSDREAAGLTIGFCGSEAETGAARRRFDILAKRLGALALGPCEPRWADHRDMLLDRGLATDAIETTASWSKLAGIYAAMRTNLDRAMRAGAPRADAHGLVLGRVSEANHESAKLRFTLLYPRMLGNDVAQAEAIRETGLKALAELLGADEALEDRLKACIKQTLDPKAILNPGRR